MSDVSFGQANYAFIQMGYELVMRGEDFALYRDTVYPGIPERIFQIDFSRGAISRRVLQRYLEHEGVPADAFFTEIDSRFG